MCVVSMVQDYYSDRWGHRPGPYEADLDSDYWRKLQDQLSQKFPPTPVISPAEISEFRELMERAREYDKKNNQPHCESEDKRQKIMSALRRLNVDQSVVDEISAILD